jgi:Holliday junction resolvase RusA-like endonuclease
MVKSCEFFVDMEPVPKLRARMGRFGVYTPEKTVTAERAIRASVRSQLARDFEPFKKGVPLEVSVVFTKTKPKSVKSKHPTAKPDLDNLIKILDALNKELWADDAQIVKITAVKEYGVRPGVYLKVWEI